jgi:transcriptional antiterminator Rof (Rho-off)
VAQDWVEILPETKAEAVVVAALALLGLQEESIVVVLVEGQPYKARLLEIA